MQVATFQLGGVVLEQRDRGEPAHLFLGRLDDDEGVVLVVQLLDQREQDVLGWVVDVVAVLGVGVVVPAGHRHLVVRWSVASTFPRSRWMVTATRPVWRSGRSPRSVRRACRSVWPRLGFV